MSILDSLLHGQEDAEPLAVEASPRTPWNSMVQGGRSAGEEIEKLVIWRRVRKLDLHNFCAKAMNFSVYCLSGPEFTIQEADQPKNYSYQSRSKSTTQITPTRKKLHNLLNWWQSFAFLVDFFQCFNMHRDDACCVNNVKNSD